MVELVKQRYEGSIQILSRDPKLANDTAGMAEVVLDACGQFNAKRYVLLQPTSPLRLIDDLQNLAQATLEKITAVSCSQPCEHPEDLIALDGNLGTPAICADKTSRRQDRKTAYRFVDGSYYSGSITTLKNTNSFLPIDTHYYTLQTPIGADIDTPFDWAMAQAQHDWLLSEGYDFVWPTH